MTTISMDISGIKAVNSQLRKYGKVAEAALNTALRAEGDGILQQSQELVPVDTGALRDSGRVIGPTDGVVKIMYGNSSVGYAAAVHEIVDAFHAVGMAKFLEIPARKALVGMGSRIARDITKATSRVK